jgi:hypothetical protein
VTSYFPAEDRDLRANRIRILTSRSEGLHGHLAAAFDSYAEPPHQPVDWHETAAAGAGMATHLTACKIVDDPVAASRLRRAEERATASRASTRRRADDSGDDNADDNLAPSAQCGVGSRRRLRDGDKGCVFLGAIPEAAEPVKAGLWSL